MTSRTRPLHELQVPTPGKPLIEGAGGGLSPESPFQRTPTPVNPSPPPPASPNTGGPGGASPQNTPNPGSSGK